MWVPHPNEIVRLQASGHGDMGDVTDDLSVARFSLPGKPFALCFIRGKFDTLSGAGGNATLSLKLDHCDPSEIYDFTLKTWPNMGTSGTGYKADLNVRLAADELYLWSYGRDAGLVFEWTNPDAGNIRWALEVGLTDAT